MSQLCAGNYPNVFKYVSTFVGTLADGDEEIVAERLSAALSGEP